MIDQAQSAFSVLRRTDVQLREAQAFILASVWQLALEIQIQKIVMSLDGYMGDGCHDCIGGASVGEGMNCFEYGQHVVVRVSG